MGTLDSRVEQSGHGFPAVHPPQKPTEQDLVWISDQILNFTEELFGVRPKPEYRVDAEIPENCYQVYHVASNMPPDEMLTKYDEWHRRVAKFGMPGKFCLSIELG